MVKLSSSGFNHQNHRLGQRHSALGGGQTVWNGHQGVSAPKSPKSNTTSPLPCWTSWTTVGLEDSPLYIGSDKDLGALRKTRLRFMSRGRWHPIQTMEQRWRLYIRARPCVLCRLCPRAYFPALGYETHRTQTPDLSDNVFVQKQWEGEKTCDTNGDLLKATNPLFLENIQRVATGTQWHQEICPSPPAKGEAL